MTMMTSLTLKDTKQFVKEWKKMITDEVAKFERAPSLAIIQIGDVEASNRYVRNKIKDCQEVGINAQLFKLPLDITTDEVIRTIAICQSGVAAFDGVMMQLPVPDQIDVKAVTAAINPEHDVDGFREDSPFYPCTPLGIMKYLEYSNVPLDGADALVIGRSDIVGKPMAKMLTDANATVTLAHSHTRNLHAHIVNADLIICAVGKARFLNCYSIYKPVIDVGINFTNEGKLVGDCFNTEGRDVTPVPGGVGLMTRAALLSNVVTAAEARRYEWKKES